MNTNEHNIEDEIEWNETRELLKKEDVVMSSLSFGEVVSVKRELFDKMIQEINDSRIQNSNLEGQVELIVISEKEENEKDKEDNSES